MTLHSDDISLFYVVCNANTIAKQLNNGLEELIDGLTSGK